MKTKSIVMIVAFLFVLGMSGLSLAEMMTTNMPSVQSYEGTQYICGGIGIDERNYLKSIGKNYDLKLEFAVKTGQYISDVSVMIKDSNGKTVLEATSDGPWLYAKLPAGKYQIKATILDKTRQQTVTIGKGGRKVAYFYWPDLPGFEVHGKGAKK